jgi:hypothetical protein
MPFVYCSSASDQAFGSYTTADSRRIEHKQLLALLLGGANCLHCPAPVDGLQMPVALAKAPLQLREPRSRRWSRLACVSLKVLLMKMGRVYQRAEVSIAHYLRCLLTRSFVFRTNLSPARCRSRETRTLHFVAWINRQKEKRRFHLLSLLRSLTSTAQPDGSTTFVNSVGRQFCDTDCLAGIP